MCLDYGPFKLVSSDQEKDLENVASILLQDGNITLIDPYGKMEAVEGKISEIDLLNQRIVLA